MHQRIAHFRLAVTVAAFATAGLGHASTPQSSQNTSTGAACRSYSTDESRVSTKGTLRVTCKFDSGTKQHVCHNTYSGPSSYSYDQTTQFASVADFVGDPARVAFFSHAQSITVKFQASIAGQVYTYDGRGYLSSITTTSSAGTGAATVQKFSAWDAYGRPTAGRDENQNFVFTYDDAKRVVTQKSDGPGGTITVKFDADANQTATTTVTPTFSDSTTITIKTTEKICK